MFPADPWSRGSEKIVTYKEKTMGEKTTMSVLEGNNFVVSDLRGDIDASLSEPLGLFAWDTRFLSRWLLTVDGQRPNVLSTDDLDYFYGRLLEAKFPVFVLAP